jgi:hypothetical protein
MSSVKRTAAFTTFVASLHAAHSRAGRASARVEASSVCYALFRFSRVLRFSCTARSSVAAATTPEAVVRAFYNWDLSVKYPQSRLDHLSGAKPYLTSSLYN